MDRLDKINVKMVLTRLLDDTTQTRSAVGVCAPILCLLADPQFLKVAIKTWAGSSGCQEYPVPSPWYSSKDSEQYYRSCPAKYFYSRYHPYGRARRSLIKHMLNILEDM